MNAVQKEVIIIAGGNGVGKTTWAYEFLDQHPDYPFLNADILAKEISPDDPEGSAISAGRAFLRNQAELIEQGRSFVLESTLSGRYLIKSIKQLHSHGYRVRIVFCFVDSSETLIQRIKYRVAKGGHFVPDGDVRRRYARGRSNFWFIYRNLVDSWDLFYNEGGQLIQVAAGEGGEIDVIAEVPFKLFLEILDENEV
jgi:predicted ABC-type ATPase